ncbi:MAG: DMT family transporter [Treponema sp.]|nr:DMT family transporter [Treponema sp.]
MNDHGKSLVFIHLSIILFGFSALFARWIDQPSFVITFGRVFFSSIFLLIFIKASRIELKLQISKDYPLIVCAGFLLAIHWYCFIQSIQLSTIAIGTITFAAFPVFVSILEPLIFREKMRVRIIVCSIIMLIAIFIISSVGNDDESTQRTAGVIIGLISSLTFAVLSLFNRYFSKKYRPEIIIFYEQASAAIILFPLMFILRPIVSGTEILVLALFGIVFTAIAHGLFVRGLRHVKVSTAGIISGLEAVYSIVLASILLTEIPILNEIVGGLIIIILACYVTISGKQGA